MKLRKRKDDEYERTIFVETEKGSDEYIIADHNWWI